jgi:hypothetical protein
MRRRRASPYSESESLQRSRRDLWTLVLLTAGLGIALNLLASLLLVDLMGLIPWQTGRYLVVLLLTLALAAVAIARFFFIAESRWVQIEIQLPYRVAANGHPEVTELRAYGITGFARRALAVHYRQGSPAWKGWLDRWRHAQVNETPFQEFIAEDNAALAQCMLLYAFHRYGAQSLSPEAKYGWSRSQLPARQLTMDDLPAGLRDNRFLRTDQKPDEWRLWWPEDVEFELLSDPSGTNPFPIWRLKHKHYGNVEICWSPHVSIAGNRSQPAVVLTLGQRQVKGSPWRIVGTRFTARARFHWSFWRGTNEFHDWASRLLSTLEEALDWGYFLSVRTDQIVASLAERIGFVPHETSVFDKLVEIEKRLMRLETDAGQNKARPAGDGL